MRLAELHPSLVHFPIALLPVAIGADAAAHVTDSRELRAVGKFAIAAAAISAAVAGVFGFIAQEEVNVDGESLKSLQTHRTLNVFALGAMTTLAVARAATKRPGLGYLVGGLATIAGVTYSAYLGGKLVYDHGVGVARAHGLHDDAQELTAGQAARAARTAAKDLGKGVWHTAREMAKGEIVPTITNRTKNGHNGHGRGG
jgi:uncharacterized membrane protein